MKRRIFASLTSVLIVTSLQSAEAQQTATTIPRIGFISSTGAPGTFSPLFEAFRKKMQDLGYVEGKNVLFDHRFAQGDLKRMPGLVKGLVQDKVDVLVAGNNVAIRAAKEATKTIPIVMISSVDPVAAGYVESFGHPGGNVTGIAWLNRDISAKRVELVKDLIPKLSRVAVLWDAEGPGPAVAVKEYAEAAQLFKTDFQSLQVRGPNPDFSGAFQSAKVARAEAIIVVGNALIFQHVKEIFELAIKARLPSMTENDRYVRAGGLISYGASLAEIYQNAATYVDAILKGAKPANLIVKQPDAFEIFINLKTAKHLGLKIPQQLLIRANELIE